MPLRPPTPRKKLTSYVGFANLPNQVHRAAVRKGFTFTAMVVGTCFFLETLPFFLHPHNNKSRGRHVLFWYIHAC